jgi:hypothetical protein
MDMLHAETSCQISSTRKSLRPHHHEIFLAITWLPFIVVCTECNADVRRLKIIRLVKRTNKNKENCFSNKVCNHNILAYTWGWNAVFRTTCSQGSYGITRRLFECIRNTEWKLKSPWERSHWMHRTFLLLSSILESYPRSRWTHRTFLLLGSILESYPRSHWIHRTFVLWSSILLRHSRYLVGCTVLFFCYMAYLKHSRDRVGCRRLFF